MSEYPDDLRQLVEDYLGGLRFSHRGDSANVYLQVLAGAARGTVEFFDESDSVTDYALQPGVAIELGTGGGVGLRIGADYRRIFSEGDNANQWRATAALVFRMGQR